ncbi:hypothetical protein BJ944DRAFT_156175 [Cunninghamella echinulata]|nr:hypothetical protein BJ944DRAFT_156175 [Cunninghamella echinulata]
MSPNYKATGYITPTANGSQYYQHASSPSVPHQSIQPMQIPIPVPMMNHHLPRQQQQQQQQQQHYFTAPNTGVVYNETGSQTYCNYLYHVGFLQGHFSDITVSIPSIAKTFALHSLIVSRSPYLYKRLLELEQQDEGASLIELDYGTALVESFHTIFTHLYRPLSRQDITYFANEKPQVCLELIDLAEYLEIPLKETLLHAILSQGFNENSALLWSLHLKPYIIIDSKISLKKSSSNEQQQYLKPWVRSIDEHLLQYLTRGLPTKLEAFTTSVKMSGGFTIGKHQAHGYMASKTLPLRGMTELAKIYAKLPWCYLKRCLENVDLPVQDSIQRYLFSKKVLQLRPSNKTTHNNNNDNNNNKILMEEGFDENSIIISLRFDDTTTLAQHATNTTTTIPSSASSALSTPTMNNSSLSNNSASNINNNSSTNKKKKEDKDNLIMTINLIKPPKRKYGKWDPSLYELESDEEDGDA